MNLVNLAHSLVDLVQSKVDVKNNVEVEKEEKIETIPLKDKISKELYLELKNNCKAKSLAAKAIRQEAIKNKGQVRHLLRELKNATGQRARIAHVALCFLRGKKYSEVEHNVEKKNRIQHNQLNDFLNCYIWGNYRKQLSNDIKRFLEE